MIKEKDQLIKPLSQWSMDYSYPPMLHRQTSLPPLDSGPSLRGNRSRGACTHYYVNGEDYETGSLEFHSPKSTIKRTSLRNLWKKITAKKKKLLQTTRVSLSINLLESYDPKSYAQNFDEGKAVVEPENLHRSFSARFVAPARTPRGAVFQRVVSERQGEKTSSWF
jgi:hypothetical protein